MKKILILPLILGAFQIMFAQPCGNSGSSQCSPSGILTQPGFSPLSQNLPPFINGQNSNTVIQFKNFNQFSFGGQIVTVQTLRFDTINNLPNGLCWSTNKSNDTYANQEEGCIKLTGATCDAPGQYKLNIIVTVNIGVPIQTNADAMGLYYFLRVKNNGDADIVVDTTQTTSNSFISYGGVANCSGTIGVSLGNNQTLCSGSSVTLNPSVSSGQSPYSYTWSANGNSLSCNNCQSPTATITQNSIYRVTVTDANNNTASAQVTYTVSTNNLQITPGGPTTFCQGSSVLLNAGQGYTSYQWSNNANTQSIIATQTNSYSVTVTNNIGCTFTSSISVTANTPSISNYQIIPNGPTSFCNGGSVSLNAGSGFNSYLWSNNLTTQTISVSQTGNYSVTVIGVDGCSYSDTQTVNANTSFNGQQACIVTVDPVSGKNVVVWEKSAGFNIDSFKIYRETSILNQYQLIRKQAFGSFSTYEDGQSNPQQLSNRYVITTVDACGESQFSTPHKTIHLTSNVGVNGEVNLLWNSYEGISYPSFNIYRGSNQSNMALLTQVSSSTNSYSDLLPPSPPLYYQIEIINPNGCVPSAKTESYSSSLSNFVVVQSIDVKDITDIKQFYILNLPGKNQLEVVINKSLVGASFNIYDLNGSVVTSNQLQSYVHMIDIKDILEGIYIAEVKSDNIVIRQKWMKL